MKKITRISKLNEAQNVDDVCVIYMETSNAVTPPQFSERLTELRMQYPDAEIALFNNVVYKSFGPEATNNEIKLFTMENPVTSGTTDWDCVYADFDAQNYGDNCKAIMVVSDKFVESDAIDNVEPQFEVISMRDGEDVVGEEPSVLDNYTNESVSERFAKYRSIFESELEEDEDEDSDDAAEENEENKDDNETDSDENTEEDSDENEDEDDEDKPLTGIIIQIKKKDVDALKDELEKYDITEDNITVIDEDDKDDEETVDVKIDIEKALELKDYLKEKKNIDLEDKLGIEFVEDDEDDTKEDDEEKDEKEEKDSEEGDEDSDDKKDEDDVNYSDFGDIFDTK